LKNKIYREIENDREEKHRDVEDNRRSSKRDG
jgi:hypothetical protein